MAEFRWNWLKWQDEKNELQKYQLLSGWNISSFMHPKYWTPPCLWLSWGMVYFLYIFANLTSTTIITLGSKLSLLLWQKVKAIQKCPSRNELRSRSDILPNSGPNTCSVVYLLLSLILFFFTDTWRWTHTNTNPPSLQSGNFSKSFDKDSKRFSPFLEGQRHTDF